MALKESGEMYLESIYILHRSRGSIRSIDIAEHMNFSKPSVSRAIRLLKDGGYILVDPGGYITLTDVGKEYACKIYERHNTLAKLLTALGVSEQTAAEDACKIEHVISEESFAALKEHLKKYEAPLS